MKTTKVQLPDKTLLTLEGGDDAVANLLINRYCQNIVPPVISASGNLPQGDAVGGHGEPVLQVPGSFGDALDKEDARQKREAAMTKQAAADRARMTQHYPGQNLSISANGEVTEEGECLVMAPIVNSFTEPKKKTTTRSQDVEEPVLAPR